VINRLAEHGFFNAGGVLIGTHAFIAMGTMLGVRKDAGQVAAIVSYALERSPRPRQPPTSAR
jgi:hypothetical protein